MILSCPHCARTLPDLNAGWQHIRDRHGAKAAKAFRTEHPPATRELSTADELVEAIEAARCGEQVPEHITLMFPDEIAEARRAGSAA